MNDMPETANLRAEIGAVLARVRRRWRTRRALLGTVWFLAASLGIALTAAATVDAWRFAPEVVAAARIASYVACAAALTVFVVVPLVTRVSDRRLALYIEEREPSLGMALASATGLGEAGERSPGLERGLLERTLAACRAIDGGRHVDAARLRRNALLVALAIATMVLAGYVLPPNLRFAFGLLYLPQTGGAAANPYALTVEPGDVMVSKGADQLIVARAEGFEPEAIELETRSGDGDAWRSAAMVPGADTQSFEMFLFDLARDTEYRVAAEGLRSSVFRIEVRELPSVERIDLTYHYPARLALPPKTVVDGGDIRAIRGSRVAVTVVPSEDVDNATLVLGGHEARPMQRGEDGSWRTELAIDEEGHYRIDLPYGGDAQVAASPNYAIEVLPDRAPAVTLSRFGRDSKVTSVEEAFIEVTGHDDVNVATLELVYAINDRPEQSVVLYRGEEAQSNVTAGHTIALENEELEPGDLIAFYARAADSNDADALTSTTDMFFMEVRPFERTFRRGQGGGGGGGQQGGNEERSLSAQQRQLVIATFKLARDEASFEPDRFSETVEALETAQARIRDRVEAIIRRIGTRDVMNQNAGVQRMREELPLAVEAMKSSEARLYEESPAEALPHARKALQHLQRAESAFREARVAFGRSSGGGARDAEDLANLFRLEMDKLRNKYENVQRGNWQAGSQQLDEALKKLEELARRQQMEIERLERRARLDPNAPSGGGSQRALAEELEEMVRRLERLSREQQTPELKNLIRQAQAAAEAMRRASGDDGNGVADARAALDRLRNIQRLADGEQPRERLERGIESASRRADRLAEEHADIGKGIEALPTDDAARRQPKKQLQSRKLRMAEEVRDLESQLRRLASEARGDNGESARELGDAAETIEREKLANNIERSAAAIDGASQDTSRRMESEIGRSLERIGEGIGRAAASAGAGDGPRRAQRLAQMRDLVEGLESLESQMLERSRSAQWGNGDPRSGWGGADGQFIHPRDFDPADVENFRRQFAERRGLLERISGVMTADEHGAEDISALLAEMHAIESSEDFTDPQRSVQRQRELIAELKELELALRSHTQSAQSRALPLAGNDTVPQRYRDSVEEYFRELSRAEPSGGRFSGAD